MCRKEAGMASDPGRWWRTESPSLLQTVLAGLGKLDCRPRREHSATWGLPLGAGRQTALAVRTAAVRSYVMCIIMFPRLQILRGLWVVACACSAFEATVPVAFLLRFLSCVFIMEHTIWLVMACLKALVSNRDSWQRGTLRHPGSSGPDWSVQGLTSASCA